MKTSFRWLVCLMLALCLFISGLPQNAAAAALQDPTPAVYGVSLTPETSSASGSTGSMVTHTLTITNTGNAEDTFAITVAPGAWAATLSTNTITLAAGAADTITVRISIPSDAVKGASDAATVTAVSTGDGTKTASSSLITSAIFIRPLVVVKSYSAGSSAITVGADFTLSLTLTNNGKATATNLTVAFESGDFFPKTTGGVLSVPSLGAGKSVGLKQPMTSTSALIGRDVGTVNVKLNYSDNAGNTYTEALTFTINLKEPDYSGGSGYIAPTATPVKKAQLVVNGYQSSVDPLQPGTIFDLTLDVTNLGLADARSVTMVVGGGAAPSSSGDGQSQQGGISGGSSDLTNFAPLGTSNLLFLDSIKAGETKTSTIKLIVNVNAAPGAYLLKLSFVYLDAKGERQVDDQMITLLVYNLPMVEISFYRDPGMITAGMPTMLPLQITNLLTKPDVLGMMRVTAEGAMVENNSTMVGPLDAGGYFTWDATLIPQQAGPLDLLITIQYTDDFNQQRVFTQTLPLEVVEMPVEPTPEGPMGPDVIPPDDNQAAGGNWFLRLIRGLLGLGSGQITQPGSGDEFTPTESTPEIMPVPLGPKG